MMGGRPSGNEDYTKWTIEEDDSSDNGDYTKWAIEQDDSSDNEDFTKWAIEEDDSIITDENDTCTLALQMNNLLPTEARLTTYLI